MNKIFQVDRDDYTRHRTVETPESALADGEIRVRVDRFAFTANNVTYAVAGDMLGYWQFFPVAADASDDSGASGASGASGDEGNWGVIPVWAFGDVVESRCADVAEGERLYGYFPPATSVVMTPVKVDAGSLIDGVEHRRSLPPLYNRYRRVLAEPDYDRAGDDATILLGPLHLTSYALGERLASRSYHGAEQVIIVSASSKTSLGLAYALAQAPGAPEVVGLTSAGNLEFVRATGLYDCVIAYDALIGDRDDGLVTRPSVVVDMSGNAAVATSLQERLGELLVFTLVVGLTHWEATSSNSGFGGKPDPDKQENFFAPSYLLELIKQLGPEEFQRRSSAFLKGAAEATFAWMSVDTRSGLDGSGGLAGVYGDVLTGTLAPSSGVVVEL